MKIEEDNSMAFNVKETRKIKRLAKRLGTTPEEAVKIALQEALDRIVAELGPEEVARRGASSL
jgi:hypothetical protein